MKKALSMLLWPGCISAAAAGEISFQRDVAPILAGQCLECHREGKAKGGYRLDTWNQLAEPGDSGEPALQAGNPEGSELFRLLVLDDEDDRMPKKADPLPSAHIELIARWIREGAVFDGPDESAALESLLALPIAQAPEVYPLPLPVTALAASPDGTKLAVGGYHEVLLRDAASGALLSRIGGLPRRVMDICWMERGGEAWLAVAAGLPGRGGELWFVRADGGASERVLRTRDLLHRVVFAETKGLVITAGAGNSIHAVAAADGAMKWQAEAHADWVLDLALSPDQSWLASGGRDRAARLIKVEDGELGAVFTAHPVPVTSLVFAPDGLTVFSGAQDGEIRRWNLEGEGLKDSTLRPARGAVHTLAWQGDKLLAGLEDGRLVRLDTVKRSSLGDVWKGQSALLRVAPAHPGDEERGAFAGTRDGVVARLSWQVPVAVVDAADAAARKGGDQKTEPAPEPAPQVTTTFAAAPLR
jgi:mono/diheme cytochrome c family protein